MASMHARAHIGHNIHHSHHLRDAVSSGSNIEIAPAATIPEPASVIELVRRSTPTASSSGGGINPTVPIAVGVAVPLAIIIAIFVVLHRRHVKKLAAEESGDPHKSLDFGLGDRKKGSSPRVKAQEMTEADLEKSLRRGRGMSIDMGNPYLLPPEVQNSRESLNSLSRNIAHGAHDPYRPATFIQPSNGAPSYRSARSQEDDASTRTGSTGRGFRQDNMNSNLLHHAQRMPTGTPPARSLEAIGEDRSIANASQQSNTSKMSPPHRVNTDELRDSYAGQDANAIRKSNNYLAGFIHSRQASVDQQPSELAGVTTPRAMSPQTGNPQARVNPARKQSLQRNPIPSIMVHEENVVQGRVGSQGTSTPDFRRQHSSPLSTPNGEASTPFYTPTEEQLQSQMNGLGVSSVPLDNRRLSIMRPLPPDDPNDTAEQRANRIRSFYKEYFSENDAHAFQPATADYYEDYGQEFYGDGTLYDQGTGGFVVAQAPFAEPITRRAMTPPPRGPPRFQGAARHQYTGSDGMPGGRSRAYSTASTSRMGPGTSARGPKRPVPPPNPLRTLPTPHLLKEDAFSLPIDFAPPSTYKDRAAGRPDSPLSQSRPFSPQVPIASPLASSFNELPVMPSPHHLRKSGTFTALDFAPPPRLFRNTDSMSDAGSVRSGKSNHSAMSAQQVHNIRSGAYRVSRIPKELVGSSTEFMESLKPTWKVGS